MARNIPEIGPITSRVLSELIDQKKELITIEIPSILIKILFKRKN